LSVTLASIWISRKPRGDRDGAGDEAGADLVLLAHVDEDHGLLGLEAALDFLEGDSGDRRANVGDEIGVGGGHGVS
jgi:hypothetical protein